MLGGTLPVPLYVRYERQFDFGPLGVTVVFAAGPPPRGLAEFQPAARSAVR